MCVLTGLIVGHLVSRELWGGGALVKVLTEEIERLKRDLASKSEEIRLLKAKISNLKSKVEESEVQIGRLRGKVNELQRLLAKPKLIVSEVERISLLSLNGTSFTQVINASTHYGHYYTITLKEVRGALLLSLVIDGRPLVGKPAPQGLKGEVIYSKPLPSTYSVKIPVDSSIYILEVKHILLWVNGSETETSIKLRVKVAAVNKGLYEEITKRGWPPLTRLFSRAVLLFDRTFECILPTP